MYFMITCLFYIALLIQPSGCKNPINDDDDITNEMPNYGEKLMSTNCNLILSFSTDRLTDADKTVAAAVYTGCA